MTVKTDYSRFHIHDELTAPEGSVKILKSVQGAAGQISKFVGVLAGAPAALRAYARMRHELRGGSLPQASRERIGLAVAERRGDPYSVAQHATTARGRGHRARRDHPRAAVRARPTRRRRRCSPSSRACSRRGGRPPSIWPRRRASTTGPTSSCSRRSRTWR